MPAPAADPSALGPEARAQCTPAASGRGAGNSADASPTAASAAPIGSADASLADHCGSAWAPTGNAPGASAGVIGGAAHHGGSTEETQAPRAHRPSPVVLVGFDADGKCNLAAWRKAMANLKSRSDHELRAAASKQGLKHSAALSRNTLLELLMQTEELCELEFSQPPTFKEFEAACKKKLGKCLTFEYTPMEAGGSSQVSPRAIHVKDAGTMAACMEWLLKQPRPGEGWVSGDNLTASSGGGASAGRGAQAVEQTGEASQATADTSGKTQDESSGQNSGVPDVVLPCVLAVELMPSVEDANKVRL